MDDSTKKIILIVVVIVAVIAAGFSAFTALSGPKEEVVGELPMPAGGGRDAEAGAGAGAPNQQPAAADPSGMPAEMKNPG
jgi:flagellar basal body-associated protein FliL